VISPGNARRRAGFTLIEAAIAISLVAMVSAAALMVTRRGVGVYESARMNASAEVRLQRAMDRVTRELMPCGWAMVGPVGLDDDYGSEFLTFQQAVGYVNDEVVWGDLCRLGLEIDPAELDDGADNDGDGLVDECQLVFVRDAGGANELTTVLCRNVRELFEGEDVNNADDNGNLVFDEAGFNVHQDGDVLTVRLCVEQAGEESGTVVRSLTTSVRLRN